MQQPPQRTFVDAGVPPSQGAGGLASAQAKAEEAAAEQMALEVLTPIPSPSPPLSYTIASISSSPHHFADGTHSEAVNSRGGIGEQ